MHSTPWYIWLSPIITVVGLIFRNQLSKIGDFIFGNKTVGLVLGLSSSLGVSILACVSLYKNGTFSKMWVANLALGAGMVLINLILISVFVSICYGNSLFRKMPEIIENKIREHGAAEYRAKVEIVNKKIEDLNNSMDDKNFDAAEGTKKLKLYKEELDNLYKIYSG